MSMVEVMIALTVVTVATYILTSTVMASMSAIGRKREKAIAADSLSNMIERIRSCPPQDVFALFNDDPSDDPYGPGTAPGPTFAVPGLEPAAGVDAYEAIGEVLMPGDGAVLNEAATETLFGLPRDLDGSLFIEDDDCSDRYVLLPVIVKITWNGAGGDRTLQMATVVMDCPVEETL